MDLARWISHAGERTPDKVAIRFEGRVGHFKHPRKIIFLPDLPRNTMGKLLYPELRAQILAGIS